MLTKAVKAGFRSGAQIQMQHDNDLDSLRDRDDFKKLIAELTNGKPKKPAAHPTSTGLADATIDPGPWRCLSGGDLLAPAAGWVWHEGEAFAGLQRFFPTRGDARVGEFGGPRSVGLRSVDSAYSNGSYQAPGEARERCTELRGAASSAARSPLRTSPPARQTQGDIR